MEKFSSSNAIIVIEILKTKSFMNRRSTIIRRIFGAIRIQWLSISA